MWSRTKCRPKTETAKPPSAARVQNSRNLSTKFVLRTFFRWNAIEKEATFMKRNKIKFTLPQRKAKREISYTYTIHLSSIYL